MVKLIDVSLDIYDGAPTFEPDPKTSIEPHLGIADLGYNITRVSLSSHFGTHLDAPFHFYDEGQTVDELDLRLGIGPAFMVDLRHKAPLSEITVTDLEPYAAQITAARRVVLHTGWDSQYPQSHYFSDQPYLGLDACQWLVDAEILAVAMDMPTIYPGEYVKAHHILLGANILVIEGLARLDQVSSTEIVLMAMPLRIRGRDGSPCRAIVLEAERDDEFEALQELTARLAV